eukprot:1146510-Pelagomonas_calceolata.AAC.2
MCACLAQGTCRLRVSLSAAHTAADVDALVAAVKSSLGSWEIPTRPGGNARARSSALLGNSQPSLMQVQYLEAQAHTPIAMAMKPWRKAYL